MITRGLVVEKILAHLNQQMSEKELVHWAEDALLELTESDHETADDAILMDVLAYIGAGDSPGFALSGAALARLLAQLGVRVRAVPITT